MNQDEQKKIAGYKAAEFVENGMIVGLGTGSTAKHAVDALGERLTEDFNITGVPTSDRTADQANGYGIQLLDEPNVESIDVTIDGADQIDPKTGLCIKGGGGAHYLEKKVAKKTAKQIIIADESKLVDNFGGYDVPLEIDESKQDEVRLYFENASMQFEYREEKSDSGNLIGDVVFDGSKTLEEFEAELMRIDGVIDTGVFNSLVDMLIVGKEDGSVEIFDY